MFIKFPMKQKSTVNPDFSINAADYYGENGGVVFPNPNAPTSKYEDLSVVEDILCHNGDFVVIVDEAYIDFGDRRHCPLFLSTIIFWLCRRFQSLGLSPECASVLPSDSRNSLKQ